MRADQPPSAGNVIPFQARARSNQDSIQDIRRESIIRLLDLSKFEQPRPASGRDAGMRANIVAMVLLALLVLLAREDFSRLERSNLCANRSQCVY